MGNPLYSANIQYAPLKKKTDLKNTTEKSQGPYWKYRRVFYLQTNHHGLPLSGKQFHTFETFEFQNCDALKKYQTHGGASNI